MSSRSRSGNSIRTYLRRFVDQGVTPDLDDATNKRVRLSNGVSLFGVFVMLASIPFDIVQAPPWMVLEDVVGAVAFLCLPLLNRRGYRTTSRMACLVMANLIVLGNAALLGHDSGAEMVFIALVALPFSLFDLFRERGVLVFGILLAVAGFAMAHSDVLAPYQHTSANYSATGFHAYSGIVALIVILFTLIQTSVANARAERALRHDIDERLRAERELADTRKSAIYAAKMATLGEMSSCAPSSFSGCWRRRRWTPGPSTGRRSRSRRSCIGSNASSTRSGSSPGTPRETRCGPRACFRSSATASSCALSDSATTTSIWPSIRSRRTCASSAGASRSRRCC
jgi:hypothetical protein